MERYRSTDKVNKQKTNMTHVPPSFQLSAFHCPHCNAFSCMYWGQLGEYHTDFTSPLHMAKCSHCKNVNYWLENPHKPGSAPTSGRMILPPNSIAPPPHAEMPACVREDYEEASRITNDSPRGAAALLRLAIQKLCKELGESGTNINKDIASLVNKGLPVQVQQALDIVRVVGNNAVHPGELSTGDVANVVSTLFELVNLIVEEQVARPKRVAEIFGKLPQGAKDQVKQRDGK